MKASQSKKFKKSKINLRLATQQNKSGDLLHIKQHLLSKIPALCFFNFTEWFFISRYEYAKIFPKLSVRFKLFSTQFFLDFEVLNKYIELGQSVPPHIAQHALLNPRKFNNLSVLTPYGVTVAVDYYFFSSGMDFVVDA